MFTVKVVKGHEETIIACEHVVVAPGEDIPRAISEALLDFRVLHAHGCDPRGGIWSFDRGLIYVMNERGKTVQSYTLGNCGPAAVLKAA